MSANIAIIQGRQEYPLHTNIIEYKSAELHISRFAGKEGTMMQLSTGITEDAYIQLNKEQIEHLKNVLNSDWENWHEI